MSQALSPLARTKIDAYFARIAQLNEVGDASKSFAVLPAITQKLVMRLRLTSAFLSLVNVATVIPQEGEKLGLGATRPIASRTNTKVAGKKRIARDPTAITSLNKYRCEQQNSDYAWRYDKLNAWAHFPNFEGMLRDAVLTQQGLDDIMIAWNGTHLADDSDPVANPLLQDMGKGWIQKLREDAPERIVSDGDADPTVKNAQGVITHQGSVKVRKDGSGDYVNLDALVVDMTMLLDERVRNSTDLVVILGADLAHGRTFTLVTQAGNDAEKMLALDVLQGKATIGGKPVVQVPFFPGKAIMVTSLKNLSIYIQEGSIRRFLRDEPDYDQVANYESANKDYVIEDYGKIAFVENIDAEKAGEIDKVPEEMGAGA